MSLYKSQRKRIYGVLIADVLASSARKDVRARLGKNLAAASEKHLRQKLIRLPEVLTAFASQDKPFNQAVNLVYGLHDTLVLQVTAKQWNAIGQFLDQQALERAAKRLKLDVSTVSRSLKRGFYWQMAETAKAAGSLIERTFE